MVQLYSLSFHCKDMLPSMAQLYSLQFYQVDLEIVCSFAAGVCVISVPFEQKYLVF